MKRRIVGLAALLAGLSACQSGGPFMNNGDTGLGSVSPRVTSAVPLTDAHLAGIALAIHAEQVQTSQAALPRLQDPQVRDFALMMVQDHTLAQQQTAQLLERMAMEPRENSINLRIQEDTQTNVVSMGIIPAAKLDRSFMALQIKMHQNALSWYDTELIPKAQDAQLKAQLEQWRSQMAVHLQEALQAQASLGMN